MNWMSTVTQWVCTAACLVGAMATVSTAWADCTNRARPLDSPVNGVRLKLLADYKYRSINDAVKINDMYYTEDFRAKPASVSFDETNSDYTNTFIIAGGTTIYWEPDGQGGERICREELWGNRKYENNSILYPRRSGAILYRPNSAQERSPILKKITPHYFVRAVRAFYYNKANQLVEVTRYESDEINDSPRVKKSPEERQKINPLSTEFCAFYDVKGRPSTTSIIGHAGIARTCSEVSRTTAKLREFVYGKNDSVLVEYSTQASKQLSDRADKDWSRDEKEKVLLALSKYGAWSGVANLLNIKDSFGENLNAIASINEKHGVFEISSRREELGIKDYTKLIPKTLKGERDIHYIFPSYTPPSILLEGLSGIYKHKRVLRTTWTERGATLFEEFLPNSHQLNRRTWYGLEGAYRDEFYKNGLLTRAINRSYALQDAGYKEDLRRYADIGVLKVTPSGRFYENYRLYEYDEKGNETFKLMCWDHDVRKNAPWKKFPWWQTETKALTESQEETYRQNNVAMRCGSPDGQNMLPPMDITIDEYMKKNYSFGDVKIYPFAS